MDGQAPQQLSTLPSPGLVLCRIGPCAAGSPQPAREGWQGAPGCAEAGRVKACHVRGAAAGPGSASHPLHPSPLVCIFISIYIYRNIYDAKCNRDETPALAGKSLCLHLPSDCNIPCSLGCPGVTGQGAGSFTFFFLIIISILLFCCFPVSYWGLRGSCTLLPWGRVGYGVLPPPRGSCLTVPNIWSCWCVERGSTRFVFGSNNPL